MLPDETTAPTTMEAADDLLTNPPEVESPEVETPTVAEEPAAQPDERPRDELGRFTEKAPKAEAEAATADPPPAPETPVEPQAEPEAPADEPQYDPIAYRADGQEITIPGSAVGEDGAFIPATELPNVLQLLSAGKAAMGSVRQRLGEAAQREQAAISRAESAEAQTQHLLSHFEQLIESGQFGQWMEAVHQNWPILKAEAKAKAIEKQTEADRQALQRYREQEEQSRLKPLMDQALEAAVQSFGAKLDEAGRKEVANILREPRYEHLVFVRAPYDDPSQGIKKGDLVIDYGVVQAEIARVQNWQARYQPKTPTKPPVATKPVEAPKNKVPPTVGAKGTRPPKQGSPIPQFKTAKEADEWLIRGGYNDLE